jgi:hypothetical protein
MDQSINFMNNNRFFFPSMIFIFRKLQIPSSSHFIFPLPVLRLIIVKRILVLRQLKLAVNGVDYSDVLLV